MIIALTFTVLICWGFWYAFLRYHWRAVKHDYGGWTAEYGTTGMYTEWWDHHEKTPQEAIEKGKARRASAYEDLSKPKEYYYE